MDKTENGRGLFLHFHPTATLSRVTSFLVVEGLKCTSKRLPSSTYLL